MHNNQTALITGASAGIGAEFARQLAAQNYNLILTARRKDRLEQLSSDLHSQFGTLSEVLVADLGSYSGIQTVVDRITKQPDLGLLVNNAGYGIARRFSKTDPGSLDAMLQVLITAVVLLSRAALPNMISRHQGSIINVASMAGLLPFPSVLYGSSKAFLINFSHALNLELTGSSVHIQALRPGFTHTEFHDTPAMSKFNTRSIPSFLWLRSDQVVRHSLKDLKRQKEVSVPGLQYQLIAILLRSGLTNGPANVIYRSFFAKRRLSRASR